MGKVFLGPKDYIDQIKEVAKVEKHKELLLQNRINELEYQLAQKNIELPKFIEIPIDREVIRVVEVPIEKIIEKKIEIVKEIFIDKPIEIFKEVFIEKVIEKEVPIVKEKMVPVIPLYIKICLMIELLVIIGLLFKR